MEVISEVILNLQTPAYSTVYAPQGDTLTRKIRARLMDGSTPWAVPSGATMVIRYRKPDGTFGYYDTDELGNVAYTVSGEYVTFTLAAQTMTVAGAVYMQLDFYAANDQHLSTFTLELDVSAAVVADGEIASDNYINALTRSAAQLAQMMRIYYGAPRTAATSAAMTDHDLVYVYTGTTGGGFTEGHWYFWNGTAWTDGGVYNSQGLPPEIEALPDEVSDLKSALQYVEDVLGCEKKTIPYASIDANGVVTSVQTEKKLVCFRVTPNYTVSLSGTFDVVGLFEAEPEIGSVTYNQSRAVVNAYTNVLMPANVHWIAVRCDSGTSDVTISPYGNLEIITSVINDGVQNIAACNPYSIPQKIGTFLNGTHLGVTFNWDDDHFICTANGTSTGNAVSRFYNEPNDLGGFEFDKTYVLDVVSTDPTNLFLEIWPYINGVLSSTPIYAGSKRGFQLPSDCTGLLMRISCTANHTFANDTIRIIILNDTGDTLLSTADDTDRAVDVNRLLNKYGHCHFGAGDFYLSGRPSLPSNAYLFGEGAGTKLYKTADYSQVSFFLINGASNITIENLCFVGSNPTDVTPGAFVETGHVGITVLNNAKYIKISNCSFFGVDRAGVYVASGYTYLSSVDIVNCVFNGCSTGILLAQYGEFAHVTNCHFNNCYYGALVHGGNNDFANCGFDNCAIGLYLYDDALTHTNNGHGTVTGSTFNHCTIRAMESVNITQCYVFIGCHFFFGGILLNNSKGVMVSDSLIKGDITVTDCELTIFISCIMFSGDWHVTNTPLLKKINCFMRDGTPIT